MSSSVRVCCEAEYFVVPDMSWLQIYSLSGESAEFEQFLEDPSIPKNKKIPALNAILEKMEVNNVTKHFFGENETRNCHMQHL